MNQQVMVMNQNAKRETGSIARVNNIAAAKAVSDIIRTTLGPRSMLKMILDASGGALRASRARVVSASMRVDVIRARARVCWRLHRRFRSVNSLDYRRRSTTARARAF